MSFLLGSLEADVRYAYKKALQEGEVEVYRGNIMFIGATGAGKTTTKNSLIGIKFKRDVPVPSTVGIDIDSSLMECEGEVDHVKGWKKVGESDLSNQLARHLADDLKKDMQVRTERLWSSKTQTQLT